MVRHPRSARRLLFNCETLLDRHSLAACSPGQHNGHTSYIGSSWHFEFGELFFSKKNISKAHKEDTPWVLSYFAGRIPTTPPGGSLRLFVSNQIGWEFPMGIVPWNSGSKFSTHVFCYFIRDCLFHWGNFHGKI